MRFSTGTAWSSAAARRVVVRAVRRCPQAACRTICGVPNSRASSSSATADVYPLTVTDHASRFLLMCEALE